MTTLAKIRAEIEHLTYYWCEINPKSVIDDVLQIIDKYAEQEPCDKCEVGNPCLYCKHEFEQMESEE